MRESKFESVSSFVDQQKDDEHIINDMLADQDLADSWSRYHLIGDVLRGETPQCIDLDIADNVMSAINEEPTVLAPNTEVTEPQTVRAKIIQLFKPVGQMAIAASAAGLMILGVQQANIASNDPARQNEVIQTSPIGGMAAPVSLNYQKDVQQKQKEAYIQQQRRMQALLADHNQQVKLHSVKSKPQSEEIPVEKDTKPKQ